MHCFVLLFAVQLASACHVDVTKVSNIDYRSLTAANQQARDKRNAPSAGPALSKIALYNVRVFDGECVGPPTTVVIDGNTIGTDANGAQRIDGKGRVLLPGLIDSHSHPANATDLLDLTRYGITTAMSMACFEPAFCRSLQNHKGLVDIKTSTTPASAPGSIHGNLTLAATHSNTLLLRTPGQVPAWIKNQTAWDPDYIKLIAEAPGLDQQRLNALSIAAHRHNKLSICHASAYEAYGQAVNARVSQVHHTPLDKPVDKDLLNEMRKNGQIAVPTLSIMRAIANKTVPAGYAVANASVHALHKAGIPILAGTDANNAPGIIASVPFGISLHQELQLLVSAGLKPFEALQAATILPARHFGLHDRGRIAPGMRADLLLVDGDPTVDITATQKIQRVWVAGIEHDRPRGYTL